MGKKVYLFGDIHCRNYTIKKFYYNHINEKDFVPEDTVIVILGDFGGNLASYLPNIDPKIKQEHIKFFDDFKFFLDSLGMEYFVVRGNHDQRPSNLFNSENWHFEQMFDGPTYVENEYPHIHYAMDYPWVYNIEGYKTLVLPGAESIDKMNRLVDEDFFGVRSWYYDEMMNKAEMDYAESLCRQNDWKFDMVLSHTCPFQFIPRDSINVSDRVTQDMEKFFQRLEYQLDYNGWAWGHHHMDGIYPRENGRCNMVLYYTPVPVEDFMTNSGKINEMVTLG